MTGDERANMMQKLYHQTLAIRPKLIKLIEKYSQKKGKKPTSIPSAGHNRGTIPRC